jgi:hypothetical protein
MNEAQMAYGDEGCGNAELVVFILQSVGSGRWT